MAIDISPEAKARVRRFLPELQEGVTFDYTSPVDYNYNCLSWALSCNTRPFENARGAFWPWENIPDDTADGWARVCMIHGFQECSDGQFEPGYEKVAIFQGTHSYDDLHAARQDKNGRWKSKLGVQGPDIDHNNLSDLKSGYGDVVRYLKRRRPDWD